MTPYDLHPPEDYVKVHENIAVANVDTPNTYVHLAKDGRRMDVEILSDDIQWGGRLAWISIVRDITERKRAEAELRGAKADAEDATAAKVIIDATKKWEYPAISLPSREKLEQVVKNWKQYELPPLGEVQIPKDL